jgi:hypothetical protein
VTYLFEARLAVMADGKPVAEININPSADRATLGAVGIAVERLIEDIGQGCLAAAYSSRTRRRSGERTAVVLRVEGDGYATAKAHGDTRGSRNGLLEAAWRAEELLFSACGIRAELTPKRVVTISWGYVQHAPKGYEQR